MHQSVYLEFEFWGLLFGSVVLPTVILIWMVRKRTFPSLGLSTVGVVLVILSGIDAVFLQRLSTKAKASASLLDDRIFASEISIALYIIPLILAGIGVNLASHVLCNHLKIAELEDEGEADGDKGEQV